MFKLTRSTMIVLTVSLVITGCSATPYQPMGFAGGYKDTHIKDNVYYVEFAANGYTDYTTTVKYFHRRAKELCVENGYTDYRIKGEKDASVQMAMATGTSFSTMNKPWITGYVECVK